MVVWDGAEATPYINESAGTPVASTGEFGETGELTLGNVAAGGNAWTGRLADAGIACSTGGADQLSDMGSYMSTLWAV